jgi:hypothetical protein
MTSTANKTAGSSPISPRTSAIEPSKSRIFATRLSRTARRRQSALSAPPIARRGIARPWIARQSSRLVTWRRTLDRTVSKVRTPSKSSRAHPRTRLRRWPGAGAPSASVDVAGAGTSAADKRVFRRAGVGPFLITTEGEDRRPVRHRRRQLGSGLGKIAGTLHHPAAEQGENTFDVLDLVVWHEKQSRSRTTRSASWPAAICPFLPCSVENQVLGLSPELQRRLLLRNRMSP